jgi:hypothetical protein
MLGRNKTLWCGYAIEYPERLNDSCISRATLLRQVALYLAHKPYTYLEFRTPLFYRYMRHPLYVGWLIAFWATPTMTGAHLLSRDS